MAKNKAKHAPVSPGWWVLYGLLCGFGAAGLVVFLVSPPRGTPVELLPAPTRQTVAMQMSSATRTALPTPEPIFVNINTANLQELETLPNIGPVTAQAIITYRQTHGPFTDLAQLQNVAGIGPRTYEGLQGLITLGEP